MRRTITSLRTYRAYETDNHQIDEEMVEIIEQAFGLKRQGE
ncbi:MAG: hypothetical protein ACYSP9_08970 [Planctomycetota bacterium]